VPEYCLLPGSHEPAFARMVSDAVHPEAGPYAFGPDADPSVFSGLGERRGPFEGGELLAACKHHLFTARVGET